MANETQAARTAATGPGVRRPTPGARALARVTLGAARRAEERLLALAGPRPADRALDLATGDGAFALALAGHCGEVVGVDGADALLAARRRDPRPNVRFVVGAPDAIPAPDAAFDLVTIAWAGHGLASWDAALAEIWRVLRPGGRVVSLDLGRPPARLRDRAWRAWLALAGPPSGAPGLARALRAYPGPRWLEARMRDRGFVTRVVEPPGALVAWNVGIKPPSGPAP